MELSKYQIYSVSKQAWQVMYQAIQQAQKSIYWELYIFAEDIAGTPFFEVLEKKAQAGINVKLIIDYLGSFWVSHKRIRSLRAAGVDVRFFHERKPRYRGWWRRLWSRSHRKILVVDEKIGFIGGVNIHKDMGNWLDIQMRMEGKMVRTLIRSFAKTYIICGGDKKQVKHLLKYKSRLKQDQLDFIFDEARSRSSKTRRKYTEALLKARERVVLFSPYYFPDKKFLYALWQARKRGVKIDLLLPLRSDIRLLTYAAYAWFALMKQFGVKIHLSKTMMHGKGAVIDDDWAIIGSTNLEYTCFYDNYEANVSIRDKATIKKLRETLQRWIKQSKKPEEVHRSWFWKLKCWTSYYIYRLWHRKN